MGKGQQQNKKSNGKKSPVEQDPLEPILKEFREEYGTDTSGSQCENILQFFFCLAHLL
jgi:hypothetical protein